MNKRICSLVLSLLIPFIVLAQTPESFQADDGETLYYTRSGSGTRVILLLRWTRIWRKLHVPVVGFTGRNQFEVVLLEQRGTGLSAKVKLDSTTINLQRACQDIDDLRNHFGDNKLTICGYSWGGSVGIGICGSIP